ncbi:MAG: undecaprenyl-diphosphate phosphatase [Phycisphaerales bacterium]|nr:undecaprenyl-diphosphate phosphatase [Phycisphaerales bacterium]
MEWWQAVILGLVEGITEFLPISSTGHLIIASALLGMDGGEGGTPAQRDAINAFTIVVQGGAILAVLGLYRGRVWQMMRGLMGKDPAGFRLLFNLGVAFMPAAVLGLLLDDWIERKLFYPGPVVAALMLGGVYMIVVEMWREGRFGPRGLGGPERGRGIEDLTAVQALMIGLLQCVAMWPGTSRSMMTITGGLFARLRPAAAAEFSFLLGLPTLGAACVYRLSKSVMGGSDGAGELKGGVEGGDLFSQLGVVNVVIGVVVATASAALAIRWLVGYLNRKGLAAFGWYRIMLGVVMLGLIAGEAVRIGPPPLPPVPGAVPGAAQPVAERGPTLEPEIRSGSRRGARGYGSTLMTSVSGEARERSAAGASSSLMRREMRARVSK